MASLFCDFRLLSLLLRLWLQLFAGPDFGLGIRLLSNLRDVDGGPFAGPC